MREVIDKIINMKTWDLEGSKEKVDKIKGILRKADASKIIYSGEEIGIIGRCKSNETKPDEDQ